MKVVAHDQAGLGGDEYHVGRRPRLSHVNNASGQHQLVQVWIDANKGIRSGSALQVDVLGFEELLHSGTFPAIEENCDVDFTTKQSLSRFCRRKRKQGG